MTGIKYQYFWNRDDCTAASMHDADCICWYDEGTGQYKGERHGADVPLVAWRIKPSAKVKK